MPPQVTGETFFLNTPPILPGANGTSNQTAVNDSGGDILVTHVLQDVRTVAAPQTTIAAPAALVTLSSTDNNKQYQPASAPTPIGSFAGTAQLPLRLPQPIRVRAQSGLNVQIQDLSNAASTYRITFIAVRPTAGV